MSYVLLRQLIETDVNTSGLTLDANPAAFKFDGVGRSDSAPYIAVTIEDAGRIPCVGNVQFRYVGNVIFDLVVKRGTATQALRDTADQIATRYGNQMIGRIQYGTISTSSPEENRYRVIVPYQLDN